MTTRLYCKKPLYLRYIRQFVKMHYRPAVRVTNIDSIAISYKEPVTTTTDNNQ